MKRVALALSALTLLIVAFGLVITTREAVPTNSMFAPGSNDSTSGNQSSFSEAAEEGGEQGLGSDRDALENMPPALRSHIEKLMQTVPNEGPAGSAADWRFMARAYPATDISVAKIEGARAAHEQHVATFAAAAATQAAAIRGAAPLAPATWVSLGPTRALYPLSPFRGYFNYVPNSYDAEGAHDRSGDFSHLRAGELSSVGDARRRGSMAYGRRTGIAPNLEISFGLIRD